MAESTSGFTPVQNESFGRAVAALPGQYVNVLTHPSIKTLAVEKEKGRWGIVWFQLLLLSVVSALLMVLSYSIAPPDVGSAASSSGISVQSLQAAVVIATAIFTLVLTPITFLLSGGILYLLARVLGGKGTYLEQISVTLLFGVPLVLLSTVLFFLPTTRNWLPWLPHLYSAVLMVLTLLAVHRRPAA